MHVLTCRRAAGVFIKILLLSHFTRCDIVQNIDESVKINHNLDVN